MYANRNQNKGFLVSYHSPCITNMVVRATQICFFLCIFLDEILECVASWKEGSSRYLVGRTLTSSSQSGNAISGSRYQCFKYEKHYDDQKQAVVTKMAQSYSGACEGLWSAEEGDRTYTLWTGRIFWLSWIV